MKLSENTVNNWRASYSEISLLEDEITDRITCILQTWLNVFGKKLHCWYFDDAEEGEVGDLIRHFSDEEISGMIIKMPTEHAFGLTILDKYGKPLSLNGSIPTRWLYEDFEEEIVQGKAAYEARNKEKKEQNKLLKQAKKREQLELIKSAKSKLSPKEIKALKL